jgi:hypothetical protein
VRYLNIAHDLQLSVGHSTSDLIAFLSSQNELRRESDFRFRNSPSLSSFLDVQLLKAKSYTSWSGKDIDVAETNLLAIVCAKGDNSNFERIKALLIRIADFLQWQLIDEQTDDGEEDLVLWSPSVAPE